MKSLSRIAVLLALTTSFAQAAPKVVEHDTCIVRTLQLDRGELFGIHFTADMSKDATKDVVRLLEQKGYIFDENHLEKSSVFSKGDNDFGLDLQINSLTGIYMERQAGGGIISNAIYKTGQFFGKQVQEIKLQVLGRGITTTKKLNGDFTSISNSYRILAKDSKSFRRSSLAKNLEFVLHFIDEDFPRCEINPDIQRHYDE